MKYFVGLLLFISVVSCAPRDKKIEEQKKIIQNLVENDLPAMEALNDLNSDAKDVRLMAQIWCSTRGASVVKSKLPEVLKRFPERKKAINKPALSWSNEEKAMLDSVYSAYSIMAERSEWLMSNLKTADHYESMQKMLTVLAEFDDDGQLSASYNKFSKYMDQLLMNCRHKMNKNIEALKVGWLNK